MKNNGTNLLWYSRPAANWNEALPLGNGRIGAMVFGDAAHERIGLNEDTLWSGYPTFYERPEAVKSFKKARELALQRRYAEAQKELGLNFTALWSQVYLPLGDLFLDMEHTGVVEDYRRTLDMSTGVHTVEYAADGVCYKRELFVSAPDGVLVMRLSASAPAALTSALRLAPASQE